VWAFDSALGAFASTVWAEAMPSCSIRDMRFQSDHCSAILEFWMRKIEVPDIVAFLLVGANPRNCPLWVPVMVQ